MKTRIMGKTVPDDRVKGGVGGGAIERDSLLERRPRHALTQQNSREPVANPAPSPQPFTFVLMMQIPSGKNAVQITRTGKRYPGKRFKAWRDAAMESVRRSMAIRSAHQISYEGPVGLWIDYVPGDRMRRDVPGLLDALCHLLEKSEIVDDDAQVKTVHWTTYAPQKYPRCSVTVKALEEQPFNHSRR